MCRDVDVGNSIVGKMMMVASNHRVISRTVVTVAEENLGEDVGVRRIL